MIYPGAVWRPGVNAGYRGGRNLMRLAVCHYTVGSNSLPVMDRGYFNFLVARDGTIYQGAEADAVTWHAGTANPYGPGIEVEYLDEPEGIFTPEAYAATAGLVEWLIGLGIPDAFYDGPRINPGSFSGFLTHRSVQQPDAHSDYWPELPRTGDDVGLDLNDIKWMQDTIAGVGIDGQTIISNRKVLDAVLALNAKIDAIPAGSGGGLTEAQVRAIVREELNKTKLGPS